MTNSRYGRPAATLTRQRYKLLNFIGRVACAIRRLPALIARPSWAARALDADRDGYLFIDNIRFVSMIAIVMRHCELSLFGHGSPPPLESAIVQFRTFGVQLFFVISAFLMADWLARRDDDVRGYLKSRVARVAIPWLVWVPIYVAGGSLKAVVRHEPLATFLPREFVTRVFFDSYWFMPVLFFSLALLLPLRRYWHSPWLGFGSLVLSLLYGVNQYTKWFPPSHTIAFFGYLFSLWLGLQLFHRLGSLLTIMTRMSWWVLVAALCLSFGLMIGEDRVMESLGFPDDTYNALQVSNQLHALVALLVLLKLPLRLVPSFIDVRRESYGIYLTHPIIKSMGVGAFYFATGTSVAQATLGYGPFARISLWFVWTAVVYGGALLTTKILRRTSLASTVGVGALSFARTSAQPYP